VKRLLAAAAVSMATLMAAALLWNFRGAAGLFVISLAVAATLRPLSHGLERHVGRAAALVVVYVAGLVLLSVFVHVVTHGFLREVDEGLDLLRIAYDRLRARAIPSASVYGFLLRRLPSAAELYASVGGARPSGLLAGLLGVTLNAIDSVGSVAIVVALSAYWSASREPFERLWLSLFPAAGRARARGIWRSVEGAVGAHLRSELVQSVLCVLLIGLTFRVARFPLPMLPALAAGVFRLVPFFGFVMAGAVSYLAGALLDPSAGALAAAYTLFVLVVLDQVLARRLFPARKISPTLTVFLMVALVDALGVAGALVASPLAAATQVFLERLVATAPRRLAVPRSLADIEARLARTRLRLRRFPAAEAAQLHDVVSRLDGLAVAARTVTEP